MGAIMNAHLVSDAGSNTAEVMQLHIDNMPEGGGAPGAGSITDTMLAQNAVGEGNIKDNAVTRAKVKTDTLAATTEALGLVKKAATVGTITTADAVAAGAAAPTKAEYDKLVALANDCKKQINALINALNGAGIVA